MSAQDLDIQQRESVWSNSTTYRVVDKEGETVLEIDNASRGFNDIDLITSVEEFYKSHLAYIEEVTEVQQSLSDDRSEIEFWVIVDEETLEVDQQIYSIEYDLHKVYPNSNISTIIVTPEEKDAVIPDKAWSVFDSSKQPDTEEYGQPE